MSKSPPRYPVESRQEMIELVRAGRNPAGLAREFGCNRQSIGNWGAQAGVDAGKPPRGKEGALTSAEREELAPAAPGATTADGARNPGKGYGLVRWERVLFELVNASQAHRPGAQAVPGTEGLPKPLLRLADASILAPGASRMRC